MRNPAQSGMAMLRLFISSSLAGTNQKIKSKTNGFRQPSRMGVLKKSVWVGMNHSPLEGESMS